MKAAHAELFWSLVSRELRSRYRGSYLGWVWALIRPLVMLLIYGLVMGVFLGAAASIPEFMVFLFVGVISWTLFSAIVTGAISSIQTSGPLIAKNRFPRVLLPLAAVFVALVDFAIQCVVLVLGYLLVSDWPSLASLTYVGPSIVSVVFFGLAAGLTLSAVNVYVRDVGFFTDVALQVGFWLCPIVYSYGFVVRAAEAYGWSVEWVTRIYMLNPMANAVLGFQRALWPPASTAEGAAFSFPGQLDLRLAVLLAFSVLCLGAGLWVFHRLAKNFAQEL